MHLLMFDIDGTLTRSAGMDDQCFARAISEVLAIQDVKIDWPSYANATDQGCIEGATLAHTGRAGTGWELSTMKSRYLALLKECAESDPNLFVAVAGAREMLAHFASRPGVAVALATGTWREAAEIKLRFGKIPYEGLPIASCSDADSREEIMLCAENCAGTSSTAKVFTTKTYIGDGLWDLRASNKLGYNFIGIVDGGKASALRAAGAQHVVRDFVDERFMKIIEHFWNIRQGSFTD
jgi:phosphoglycolate phosphatase-like HAD superfamily hydrolase